MTATQLPDDPSVLTASVVAEHLGVDPARGLDEDEARRRLAADGPNELAEAPPVPAWRKLVGQLRDPLVYLLIAAVLVSVVAWIVEGAHGLSLIHI